LLLDAERGLRKLTEEGEFAMGKRRLLLSLAVFAVLIPAAALAAEGQKSLATMLPADKTDVYVNVDLQSTLDQASKSLDFLDPASAERIRTDVKDLYSEARELAAQYDFKPALLDHLSEVNVSMVLMPKEKPETVSQKIKVPKYNKETFEQVPGEFDEIEVSETHSFTFSVVLLTPSADLASDFLKQVEAMLDAQKEKEPNDTSYNRTDIQVDKGQLISTANGKVTVGCLDNAVVISTGDPKELWAAMMAAPAGKLSETPMFQKMVSLGGGAPDIAAMANVADLLKRAEAALKGAVDEAQKAADKGKEQGQAEQGGFDMAAMQLTMAQAAYNSFTAIKQLMSLDKLEWASVGAHMEATDNKCSTVSYLLLSHGQPLSPVMSELLNGSGKLQPPAVSKPDSMTVMARVDIGKVITEILNSLTAMGGPIGGSLQMQLQQVKQQLGVGVEDLLALPASDFYVYLDLAKKEVEESNWQYDDKTQQWNEVKTKQNKVVPEVDVYWGVKDPSAAHDTLDKLVTGMSASQELNAFAKKRTYQGTDVYCFGSGVTEEETYPDGRSSFAIVIVGRYLTLGSWDDATKAVRELGAGGKTDEGLMSIVQANPDANLLVVVPKAFQEKSQQLSAEMAGTNNAFDMLIKGLAEKDLGLKDKDLEQRVKKSLTDLIQAYQGLATKAAAHAPAQSLMVGRPDGNFYEITSRQELTK
jgi:hypothetical protein